MLPHYWAHNLNHGKSSMMKIHNLNPAQSRKVRNSSASYSSLDPDPDLTSLATHVTWKHSSPFYVLNCSNHVLSGQKLLDETPQEVGCL